ncbi:Virginiamycin A acetyltransferase [Methylobacterium thuringiense]|uniref:Virginiamycin A acetyltransferase n=2 Tax=Methylobacteriaceae TaxID=119045 RepID=A0ABQ4TLS0_9HYPH|nr:Virginiamycin A acetyltransferase [Methylobacterium thuringiense]
MPSANGDAMPHDPRFGPDPDALHPMPGHRRVTFVKNLDLPENVSVGAYTYYDDPAGPNAFLDNILYHFPFIGDRLTIGRFCAMAAGTRFLMNGGNHRMSGPSTYPFPIFGGGWTGRFPGELDFPNRGDTVVGHDVWFGMGATVMPGVTIGDGAVIGTLAVVAQDVPPYAIVAGNPARIVRRRVSETEAARLQAIAWWDWEPERLTRALPAISGGDVDALKRAAGGSDV